MTLTDRLTKLNATRELTRKRIARKAEAKQSTAADYKDHVRQTCKVLKLERKLERAGV